MNTYWFNKLIDLLKVQSNSENEKLMVLHLDKELRKLKLSYTIDAAGNILVVKGEASTYPCVVSHMDTVHNFVGDFKIYTDIDDEDIYFAKSNKKRVGIGGDDKCGIFACLYLLKKTPDIKIVFFSREERGCRGSRAIDKTFFADCRYIIQLDRRGKRDFIQTYWGNKTVSHEFSSEIGLIKKKWRYKNATGTITDVMKLWDNKVGISCVNLSCGYYRPHSDYEYISINDLWRSVKFTEDIVNTLQPKRYASLPPEPVVVKTSVATNHSYTNNSRYIPCCVCQKYKKSTYMLDVKGHKDKKICWLCRNEQILAKNGSETKQDKEGSTELTLFACAECGIKTSEMKAGDSLKLMNGVLYCNDCTLLVDVRGGSPIKCDVCEEVIPKNHYYTQKQGMLVCGVCANDLDKALEKVPENAPIKCWVCDRVIPKDHKILMRFGTQVCEDCACPNDVEVDENGGTSLVK